MASSKPALLILLNIVFFTMVSSTNVPCGCSTPKSPTPKTPTPSTPKTPSAPKTPTPSTPQTPSTPTPTTPSGGNTPSAPPTPTTPSGGNTPTPSTPSGANTPPQANCPIDILRLGVCGNVLSGLVNVVIAPRQSPCCSLINGLADLDAAVCLCTAIRANVLGININVPVSLSLLLNYCGQNAPSGFQCA